jgi:hypothetical protein
MLPMSRIGSAANLNPWNGISAMHACAASVISFAAPQTGSPFKSWPGGPPPQVREPKPGRMASWLRMVRDDLRQLGVRDLLSTMPHPLPGVADDLRTRGVFEALAEDAAQRATWRRIIKSPMDAAPLPQRQCVVCKNIYRTPAALQSHRRRRKGNCKQLQAEQRRQRKKQSKKPKRR